MPEVYRVLFEVFGMDPEAEECQPKLRRQLEDVDFVSVEFEQKKLSWQEVAAYRVNTIVTFTLCPTVCVAKMYDCRQGMILSFFVCSLRKMLYLHIHGCLGLVFHLVCIASEETYGILKVDPKLCER